MRLLNTKTFELKTFFSDVPEYVIISHTWEEEEVTYEDLNRGGYAQYMKGYAKLRNSAILANDHGYQYIWIDTCCIDKSSSSELSEAINSMYRWYKESAACYAYLSDVMVYESASAARTDITMSKWFTRGWTLQEPIAPKLLLFYSSSWEFIGSRDEFEDELEQLTMIPKTILRGGSLSTASAANKMSWAANRVTTRPEDIAYCLLGIFSVNMPLLYGEGGEKAFVRLQEEFLKFSDDGSIFAWESDYIEAHPTNITNRGVHIEFPLIPIPGDKSGTIHLALLQCERRAILAIVLQRISGFEQEYTRIAPNLLVAIGFNLFSIPISLVSRDFHKESLQRGEVLESNPTEVSLRATDIHARILFVKPTPTHFEQIGRFYLKPELKIGKHIQCQVTASVPKTALGWVEWGVPKGDGVYYMTDLELLEQKEVEQLKPETLLIRKVLASLELELSSPSEQNHKGWTKSVGLAIGLEPLPDNPFMTPPAFVRPWYGLFRVNGENSLQSDPEDALGTRQSWKLPTKCRLQANITVGTHFEQLIYNIQLEIVSRDE
ncbi:hypothetical protein AK830_g1265 [Neonectria ditissima]|uniref:Heterokaryon incompatibility domain-containing protein n=1 Tax=Neonectria ditissima TaxID=78410 RepID=A0A0P7BJ98_9HYPO|nr:hypothetical protein AK830_g1265 [Neonectria ditissima]